MPDGQHMTDSTMPPNSTAVRLVWLAASHVERVSSLTSPCGCACCCTCCLSQDVVVPVAAMKPPFKGARKQEVERLASQILFPVTVEGDRQYYLSIHAGKLFEPQVRAEGHSAGLFVSLLSGFEGV